MKLKHSLVRFGMLLGIAGGMDETELHAQFSGDYQTNTINTASNWPGDYFVGSNFVGDVLEILPGGVLSNGTALIGYLAGADNNAAIVNGGLWLNEGIFGYGIVFIGVSGSGNQLTVTNGGMVFSEGGYLGNNDNSSNNLAVITGTGSIWSNQASLAVGFDSPGNRLIVTNGGAAFSASGDLGVSSSSSNNVAVVTGNGSVWSNQAILFIGFDGAGNQLIVTNGGTVFNTYGYLGFKSSSSNNVAVVTGNGTKWESRGDLYVGRAGDNNTLNISMGGSVIASNVYVGFHALSAGNQINVTGGGLYATNALGTGALDMRRGALNLDAGMVMVDRLFVTNGANSVIAFNGGTLSTKGTTVSNGTVFVVGDGLSSAILSLEDGTHTFFDGLQISSNATLMGTGTIVGDLFTPGTLAPGHSPGLITVDGNLTMSNTTVFDLELGGLAQGTSYDFVHVTSNAILDGTLVVSFVDGFQSTVTGSDVFTNLLADASLSGAFANVLSGNRLDTANGYGSFLVTYDDGNNLILSDYLAIPIPEPATMVLLALGGLVLRRRRNRRP